MNAASELLVGLLLHASPLRKRLGEGDEKVSLTLSLPTGERGKEAILAQALCCAPTGAPWPSRFRPCDFVCRMDSQSAAVRSEG
jgi:hypothetical protein